MERERDLVPNIGDNVICISDHPDENEKIVIGSTGVVCDIYEDSGYFRVGVRWDDDVDGHACSETCDSPHGWYVSPNEIEVEMGDEFSVADEFEVGDLLS